MATVDGESPLKPLSTVNDECDEVSLEDEGVSMVMTFDDLSELEGTKMSVALGELNVDMMMGGSMEGNMIVAGFATGLQEDQLQKVVQAQVKKMKDTQG